MTDVNYAPACRIGHLPTPLEPLPRLSEALGGPALYVKRDDCTGLATGGNKTRKLEYLMADASAHGADVVVTQGAVQSNHVRQTAAAAAKLGFGCHALLEERLPEEPADYASSGNVFLDTLFGATIERREAGADMDAELAATAEALRSEGSRPYVIPGGGSNTVGARGYVACLSELLDDAQRHDLRIDHIVHATGSAGTQAGLVAGKAILGDETPVHGISVRFERARQEEKVYALASELAHELGAPGVARDAVTAYDGYVGPGYGHPTDGMVEAIELVARTEGLLLDPVYSGKGMAGLIDLVRQGRFAQQDNVVFLHTGGAVSLFGYTWAFSRHDAPVGQAAAG